MGQNIICILAEFYALDHLGKFHFCKNPANACYWVNANSTKDLDCRICIEEAMAERENLSIEQKHQIRRYAEKDLFN